jgi:type IV pilus assembly protein PilV
MKTHGFVPMAGRRRIGGMTMIEVLVTLVIVSFGLLGVGALQLMSLQVNQGANQRTQASMLALSALDAIRGNRGNAPNYARGFGAAVPAESSTNVHEQDLAAIVGQVQRVLPGGDMRIQVTNIAGLQPFYQVNVTVRWNENDRQLDRTSASAPAPTQITVQSRI